MMQMNNALMYLINAARSGANPRTVVQRMAQSDPKMRQFAEIINGKDEKQLEQIARNMANERGIDLDRLAQDLNRSFRK